MTIQNWPNGLGAMVNTGRLHIEIWEHGGVRRCVSDESLTGYTGTHYAKVARDTIENMAKAAVELWKSNPNAWTECEP